MPSVWPSKQSASPRLCLRLATKSLRLPTTLDRVFSLPRIHPEDPIRYLHTDLQTSVIAAAQDVGKCKTGLFYLTTSPASSSVTPAPHTRDRPSLPQTPLQRHCLPGLPESRARPGPFSISTHWSVPHPLWLLLPAAGQTEKSDSVFILGC